jgi:site-specific DNA recombinase
MSRRASLAIVPDPAGESGPVRVATYSRISTDEERQPNSLEAQRVRLDSFVASQPEWSIGRRYEDQFTGTVIDRPARSPACSATRSSTDSMCCSSIASIVSPARSAGSRRSSTSSTKPA